MARESTSKETQLLRDDWQPDGGFASLSVPVARASTVLFPDAAAFNRRYDGFYDGYTYGLYGTPTSKALEAKLCAIYSAPRALLTQSGQAAVVVAILANVSAGGHVLVADSVYGTTRSFCQQMLRAIGVEAQFYDPMIGSGIAALIHPDTRLIVIESPGSNTMEVQDTGSIARAARAAGVLTIADNSWASGLLHNPLDLGVDIVVEALSKHAGGHADVLMGAMITRDETLFRRLKDIARMLGTGVSADDASLVLRGLQTMAIRLQRSSESALRIARWLQSRDEVQAVLYPPLQDFPGHDLWRRDFNGANGLFSIILNQPHVGREDTFIDALRIFRIGASWAGTQSLVAPQNPASIRDVVKWDRGALIRFSIGLEPVEDLINDIEVAFSALDVREQRQALKA